MTDETEDEIAKARKKDSTKARAERRKERRTK